MKVVVAVADLLVRSRIEAAARAAGHEVAAGSGLPVRSDPAPDLLIVDLDAPGMLEAIEPWRSEHPASTVTGIAFHVNVQVIERARAMGVRVVPHGVDPATLFG